ncbi:UNVERIFIED_CONTAM: hypothetical protein HDU68_001246 [Siphonaria sp. JEL0065]|nr:hypothetical protein HDU68_001246 [Siphonaria sp. JEL0065]
MDATQATESQHIDRKRPRSAATTDEQTNRGKRMFGALMGTLTKQTTTTKTEAEKRREEIEKRLREKLEAEKALLAQEVEKEKEAKAAEKRERLKEESEKRELLTAAFIKKQKENLAHFIKTKTEPAIYFLPGKHNDKTRKLLEAQQLQLLEEAKKHADACGDVIEEEPHGKLEKVPEDRNGATIKEIEGEDQEMSTSEAK